jgi:hypothetical protein
MLSLQEYNKSKNVKDMVEKMFEARQVAHNCHLKSKSHSEHVALNEFYDELLSKIDEFVETYQGQYGLLSDYEIQTSAVNDVVSYLEDCAKIFSIGRDAMKGSDSHLKNILDEAVGITYRTVYKLKFLK